MVVARGIERGVGAWGVNVPLKRQHEGYLCDERFCILTVSASCLRYCTVVLQDVAIGISLQYFYDYMGIYNYTKVKI